MSQNKQLQKEGVFYCGSDVKHQILYVMGNKDTKTYHIHVVKWNGTEWKHYIHLRDYLNVNVNMALQYQELKEELESKYADDRISYAKGKKDMINIFWTANKFSLAEALVLMLEYYLRKVTMTGR